MARTRRTAKWIVTTAAVALLVLAIPSVWYYAGWSRRNSYAFVATGCLTIRWVTGGPPGPIITPETKWLLVRSPIPFRAPLLLPRYDRQFVARSVTFHTAIIPLWIPILTLGLVATRLWILDRRTKVGCCTKCGYDLSGIAANVCPECGQATGEKVPA